MRTKVLWTALILLFAFNVSAKSKRVANLNVATFNIRMDTPIDSLNPWKHRKDLVNGLVRFHGFDVFGIQEGFHHQIMDILEPGGYDYVGVGREDGKDAGEHCAIIYKKDRLLVIDNGDFWLSETPDVPGKGWDATCCNRVCSWAKFKDVDSGKKFYFFNVHFDHQGKEARRQSSYLLLNKIREIANGYPVIATGDFNAGPDSEPIQIIMKDGLMNDLYAVSLQPPYGTEGTYNSFRVDSPLQNRIDYIWVTNDIIVNKYGVLSDIHYGHFPSDHFPVMVNLSF